MIVMMFMAGISVQAKKAKMRKQLLFIMCVCFVFSTAQATMLQEVWNVDLTDSDLDVIEAYMADNVPDETYILDESWWRDLRDYYIVRLSGWVTVPATGSYQFHVSSDDWSWFYVSPDRDPANAVQVANIDRWVNYDVWDGYDSQHSDPISLKRVRYLPCMLSLWNGTRRIICKLPGQVRLSVQTF